MAHSASAAETRALDSPFAVSGHPGGSCAVVDGCDGDGVSADDGSPGFFVGLGGAVADAGGAGEGGEHAAGCVEGANVCVATEEGFGEVLDGGEEVGLLGLAVGGFE